MVQTPITDGGFEDVTALNTLDATSGGWTVSGPDSSFQSNANNNPYQTPYGSIFVLFFGGGYINSVSQQIDVSACQPGTRALTYSYSIPDSDTFPSAPCILSVTYGGVTIDSITIVDFAGWTTRTTDFAPSTTSATLSFIFDCSRVSRLVVMQLDNISVT
jgi:hypothetical protein